MQASGQDSGIIFEKLKTVLSENHSLAAMLELANATINSRDLEIEILQQMVDEGNEIRSNLENRTRELALLQQQLEELRRLISL